MNEETADRSKELQTVDGTYIDSVSETLNVPILTNEEADEYKEQENIEIEMEGGK